MTDSSSTNELLLYVAENGFSVSAWKEVVIPSAYVLRK